MRDVNRGSLTLLGALLALWLIWGFWPLLVGSQVALSLLVILVCGVMLWRQGIGLHTGHDAGEIADGSLPPENFQGAVILVGGDSAALFDPVSGYRETRQGWYLQVEEAEQLPVLARHLSLVRPALISQISFLVAILPEHHHRLDDFTQCLRGWQRAIVQCRPWLGGVPPVWAVTWVSPPDSGMHDTPVWFTAVHHPAGTQVHQPGQGNVPLADWINENAASGHFNRLSQALWLHSLLGWQGQALVGLLTEGMGELPLVKLCAQGFCIVPVSGRTSNLWQQHIAGVTALPPQGRDSVSPLPLPEPLLSGLPRRKGVSRRMMFWRDIGLCGGLFLLLVMLASFVNNQRLILNVGDHLAASKINILRWI